MFRIWLSSFWKNNKEKFLSLAKVLGIVILVGIAFAKTASLLNLDEGSKNEPKETYTPEKTVISGGNVSEKKFEEQNNLVKTFVDYCNAQNYKEAYNLLTDDCKEKMYPSLSDFENKYCKIIFNTEREYNLQSWISSGKHNTYKVRFMEDLIEKGTYDDVEKYEDYITIVEDGDEQKLNINGYIKTEELNKQTKTDKIVATAMQVDTYMNYVKYKISIKNISNSDILLDDLKNKDNIKLAGTNGANYRINSSNLMWLQLLITRDMTKEITLTFNKQYGSDVKGRSIEFNKAIEDYNEYKDNNNYEKYIKISINL